MAKLRPGAAMYRRSYGKEQQGRDENPLPSSGLPPSFTSQDEPRGDTRSPQDVLTEGKPPRLLAQKGTWGVPRPTTHFTDEGTEAGRGEVAC